MKASLRCSAICRTHVSGPRGRPRWTQVRIPSICSSCNSRWTRASQFRGRPTGQGVRGNSSHPAHPTTQCWVRVGPNHQMPMVGHQAVGQQLDRVSLEALRQRPLERFVVARIVKQPHPPVPAIENVVDHPRFARSARWRHGSKVSPCPSCRYQCPLSVFVIIYCAITRAKRFCRWKTVLPPLSLVPRTAIGNPAR